MITMLAASLTYGIIRGTLITIVVIAVGGWLLVRSLKRSDDPSRLIFKWFLTALVVGFMIWKVAPLVGRGGYEGAFIGIPVTAACGLTLAIIWRYNIASIIAKPFSSLYDGGDAEIEPRPYYSSAEAKRKKGQYREAIGDIRKQLEKFPTDFEGQMKMAEIQAENLNDLPGADVTIQRLCLQPDHPQRNISFALNTLADWHLKYGIDREAAQASLQKIIDRFPESEFALLASQRIAHLGSTEHLMAVHDRKRIAVPEGVKNVGLLQSSAHLQPAETDHAALASQYVKHLEQHPQDTEVREKLAVIYADHYGRLELAADQLEQLINQPSQPGKLVVHWLNLLADLQSRHGADYETVRATLERIIEKFPNIAAAEQARTRIDLLALSLKTKTERPGIKMGTYEQNIGLKRSPPRG